MSYSVIKTTRTKASMIAKVKADTGLPDAVKVLIEHSVEGLGSDTDERFIRVEAYGHQDHKITVQCFYLDK